jgi:integrase
METHYAAMTDPKAMGALLRAIDGCRGRCTDPLRLLAPLTFVRPEELRHAEWSEFDLDQAEWNIAA